MRKKGKGTKAAGVALLLCTLLAALPGLAGCGAFGGQARESSASDAGMTEGAEAGNGSPDTQAGAEAAETDLQAGAEATETDLQEGAPGTEEIQTGPLGAREENMIMEATGSFEGIVVDASMNSLVIDTKDGLMYSFSYPESGVEMELADGLLLGMSVLVKSEDGIASDVQDGPTQPAADRDALAFAADILFACRYASMDSLANLAVFPLYVRLEDGDVTVQDAEEFLALPAQQIFSQERMEAVLSTNLYAVTELSGGKYVLGSEEGTPNIIFRRDDGRDSGFAIAGIN